MPEDINHLLLVYVLQNFSQVCISRELLVTLERLPPPSSRQLTFQKGPPSSNMSPNPSRVTHRIRLIENGTPQKWLNTSSQVPPSTGNRFGWLGQIRSPYIQFRQSIGGDTRTNHMG